MQSPESPAAPSDEPLAPVTRTWLVGIIVALVSLLALNAGLSYQAVRNLREESAWVEHTREVLEQVTGLVGIITDAETGQRGYLLTDREEYLEPYHNAVQRYPQVFTRIDELVVDNPVQRPRVQRMKELVAKRLETLKSNLDRHKSGDNPGALQNIAEGSGKRHMDDLRALADDMKQEESRLLANRRQTNSQAFVTAVFTILVGPALAMIVLGAFVILLRKYLQHLADSAAAIHQNRELLQATLASIGDGVIATDAEGRVTFMNAVAERLTGWEQIDARSKSLVEVFHIVNEETRHEVENPAARACREGQIVGLANHTILIARNGTEWPIDDSAAPIRTPRGEITGAVLVFREIAERKRQEAQLRQHAEALTESDRRKTEFLAILAHELRNPLAPISNALQLWPMFEDDRVETAKLRAIMGRQLRQITRLIDDLLDVSRISRGRIQLQQQNVDLRVAVSEALEANQPLIQSCGHRLSMAVPDVPVMVYGDVARLTQVFGNIIHNAAKYTGRDGVISISVERRRDKAVVSVRDNGPGIPPEMLSHVFELFRQVHETLDRSFGGLGIGLTLVKQLVDLHGGTVEALSKGPGKGSEFIVSLPALAMDDGVPIATHGRHFQNQFDGVPQHRILVVDDIEASATTLAMILQGIGQQVVVANDGPSAIEKVQQSRPDLVFLDIAMPGMDGYEVARRLRAADGLDGMTLVALTGYGQEEDRKKAIEAGFDRHMTKPASIEELTQLLRTVPAPYDSSK